MLGAVLACAGASDMQAQAPMRAEPRLQPVRRAPLKETARPRARQRLLLPSSGLPAVDDLPELIGGLRGLVDKMRYPRSALANGIQGVVRVSFVVNEQGYAEQAVVTEGVGGGCDEEVLRIIRQARFKPGAQMRMTPDGNWVRRVVPVPMSLPFKFELHNVRLPEMPQRLWTW